MNSVTEPQSRPVSPLTFYDMWRKEQWIGMAIGDTPSAARQYIMESLPGEPGHSNDFILIPFYGLNTSQNTFRALGTLRPQFVNGADVSVSPDVHGVIKYDVWHNRYWMGTVEATTPSQARLKADEQWPTRDCHEILLAPNHGEGTEYSTFEALRGCRAKRQNSPQAIAS
mgnify:CR=1 FL=1